MEQVNSINSLMTEERKNNITDVIKTMSRRLFNFISKRVPRQEDAEDILQEVFYQFAGNTEPIEQTVKWLFTVTRNKITDSYRKKKLPFTEDVFSSDPDEEEAVDWKDLLMSTDANPETVYLKNLFWETLYNALEEIPKEQKEVFVLNEIEGIPFKDISEKTGTPIPTLISRKRYAVLFLRDRLKVLKNELLNY